MVNGILYCKSSGAITDYARLDSAIYLQPDGTKIVYFVFENKLKTDTNVTVNVQQTVTKSVHDLNIKVGSNNTTATTSVTTTTVSLKDNSYFEVSGNTEDVYVANLTNSIKSLQSTQGYYPPNLVYGAITALTHP